MMPNDHVFDGQSGLLSGSAPHGVYARYVYTPINTATATAQQIMVEAWAAAEAQGFPHDIPAAEHSGL